VEGVNTHSRAIAEVLKVSPVTVKRDWRAAKAWLFRELTGGRELAGGTADAS